MDNEEKFDLVCSTCGLELKIKPLTRNLNKKSKKLTIEYECSNGHLIIRTKETKP